MTAEQRAEHEAENALRRQRRKEEEDRQEAERKKPLFPTATDEQLNNLLEKHRDEMVTLALRFTQNVKKKTTSTYFQTTIYRIIISYKTICM
jgi:hypothetical protein